MRASRERERKKVRDNTLREIGKEIEKGKETKVKVTEIAKKKTRKQRGEKREEEQKIKIMKRVQRREKAEPRQQKKMERDAKEEER